MNPLQKTPTLPDHLSGAISPSQISSRRGGSPETRPASSRAGGQPPFLSAAISLTPPSLASALPGCRTYSGEAPASRAAGRSRRTPGGGSRSPHPPWRPDRRLPAAVWPVAPRRRRRRRDGGEGGDGGGGVGARPLVPNEGGSPRCGVRQLGARLRGRFNN